MLYDCAFDILINEQLLVKLVYLNISVAWSLFFNNTNIPSLSSNDVIKTAGIYFVIKCKEEK